MFARVAVLAKDSGYLANFFEKSPRSPRPGWLKADLPWQ